jgi:DNA mismatch repair ATPase MutS
MHVHIARSKRDAAPLKESPLFAKISESGTTCSFFYQEWSVLGGRIVDVSNSILSAEREAFEQLRSELNTHSGPIRRNARIVDELDVTLGFADLAEEMRWVQPELTEETTYHVENGRHPTVELGLLTVGRVFTANTVSFSPTSSLHIITGPNMAGKSTLLRQTALIALLAQVGSFVPADSARLGIADQLFARVGAKDDLFRDRSTFMVEMLETAEILRRATPKSLVIMDEVGRGTTVQDGIAIAFSTIVHLLHTNQCRTLFATHFHELADMLGFTEDSKASDTTFAGVDFFCTDVQEAEVSPYIYCSLSGSCSNML